jgi:hypothetical protein
VNGWVVEGRELAVFVMGSASTSDGGRGGKSSFFTAERVGGLS